MDLQKDLDLAAELLSRSPAEQWEVWARSGRGLEIALRGQELDKFERYSNRGLALRVILEGKAGFAFVVGEAADGLARAVEEALASARGSDLENRGGLTPPPESELPQCQVYDPALAGEPLERKRERALEMARAAQQADPRVVHVHPAEYAEGEAQVWLRNSLGLELSHRSTVASAGVVAMAADEKHGQEVAYESDSRRFLAELDPAELGRRAGRRAASYLGGEPMPDGRYDVVLENRVAAQFVGLLAHSFLGDNLVKGRSLLGPREGRKALSELVTLLDDGLWPKGLGTAPFDGEGTLRRRTVLVERGVVRGFVFDRLWAAAAGRQTTGNAGRGSLKAPPGVGFSNLVLEPGQGSRDELVSQVERGMLITEIMGGHTADPISGEFSFGASGYLIEKGRVGRPVKSMAMAGQVVELFNRLAAVGGDLEFFGSLGVPSLLVSDVSLSGP